jgi:hypothetical protein
MLDVLAALFFASYFASQLVLLIGFATLSRAAKLGIVAVATLWFAGLAAVYALGGLTPGALGPVPVNLLPFTLALAVLFGGWFLVPSARRALLSMPLPALMALHAGRIGGVLFIALYLQGRLSAPFGPVAGLGDVITGAVALGLAPLLALGVRIPRAWLRLWNVFGALDLIVAIVLAALATPGTPFRLFTDAAGTQVMGTLPWIFAPALLVPIDLLAHVVIAAKLRHRGSAAAAHEPRIAAWEHA